MKDDNLQAKKRGAKILPKVSFYSLIQNYTKEAIDQIVLIMRESRNEPLRFAAARLIIDKTIADVKAVQITGKDGGPIKFNVITGSDYLSYLSKLREVDAPSAGSVNGISREVQSTHLAQESEKNDNSDNTTSEVGAA